MSFDKYWKKSKLGSATFETKTKITPYLLPDKINEESGNNIFGEIAAFLVETLGNLFERDGYIDLDKEWRNANYQDLLDDAVNSGAFKDDIIQQMEDDAEWIAGIREQLLKDHPKPYSGRKAYAFSIEREDFKTQDESGKDKIVPRWRNLRPVKSKYPPFEEKIFMYSRICVFHNKALGYNPDFDRTGATTTNGKGEVVEMGDKLSFTYCGIFMNDKLSARMGEYFKHKMAEAYNDAEYLAENGVRRKFEGAGVFFFCPYIKTNKQKADTKNTKKTTKKYDGPSYSIDADDVVFMEGYFGDGK